ncbi:hypothetical protein SASPL_102864 [Salvia splendens]|uniref:Uncharacterized protein n=1 Tax=Salvia splendens TaxID=180675 RepID=A0A8X8YS25_SALSN|nr:hypothetical protein SASPL_102864 [Salvia splendens]
MRTPCSHTCLAFILKFLNFLNAFVGVVIIIYSAYVLNQLHHHPPPNDSGFRPNSGVFNPDDALTFNFSSLPAPWFTYAFLATGILIVFISFVGFIGAEAISGCCLCFYAVLTTLFILSEVGLVIFIALDRQWEKDIPFDPTGELDRLWTFINDNADVFMWVGIVILSVQARFSLLYDYTSMSIVIFYLLVYKKPRCLRSSLLPRGSLHIGICCNILFKPMLLMCFHTANSELRGCLVVLEIMEYLRNFENLSYISLILKFGTDYTEVLSVLLAVVLRSLVSSQNEDDDLEAEYGFRNSSREPLVSPYSGQASGSARGDSDIWSVRMREKVSAVLVRLHMLCMDLIPAAAVTRNQNLVNPKASAADVMKCE